MLLNWFREKHRRVRNAKTAITRGFFAFIFLPTLADHPDQKQMQKRGPTQNGGSAHEHGFISLEKYRVNFHVLRLIVLPQHNTNTTCVAKIRLKLDSFEVWQICIRRLVATAAKIAGFYDFQTPVTPAKAGAFLNQALATQ